MKEFPLVLECKLVEVFELGLHTQFVGAVIDVKAEKSVMSENGLVEIERLKPLVFSPDTLGYYRIGPFIGQAFGLGRGISKRQGSHTPGYSSDATRQPSI